MDGFSSTTSPFNQAAILTVDGVGEWATASYGIGEGKDLTILKELHFPDSLGLLYSGCQCSRGEVFAAAF